MSYLLDKKIRRKKFFYVSCFVVALLVLFYFRTSIFNGLAYISHQLFRPVLVAGHNIGEKLAQTKLLFVSKNTLLKENEDIKSQLKEMQARMSNYNSLLLENLDLKEMQGKTLQVGARVLASILSKPSRSPYDTLIIDAGVEEGIERGDMVFALGDLPIGRVAETYPRSSKVILFSSSGERTQVVVANSNIFLELVGRGGGNFEMTMPRGMTLGKGGQVILPGSSSVVGIVATIISDPRSPFVKALLVSPVNIQEIRLIQVETRE